MVSYRAVDIPADRILIIDKQGRVRRADSIGFETSFMSLAMDTVDYMFPPLTRRRNDRQKLNEPMENSFLLAPSFYKAQSYRFIYLDTLHDFFFFFPKLQIFSVAVHLSDIISFFK